MPLYRWKGVDLSGKAHQGTLMAASPEQLVQTLLKQNVAVLEHTTNTQHQSTRHTLFTPRITQEQLCTFFERLGLLITSGVELVQALSTMAQALEHTPLGTVAASLAHDINAGLSFQQALTKHPEVFAPFIKQLVSMGEQTGKLATVLEAVAQNLRRQQQVKQELNQAAIGPLITLGAAVGLMTLIVLFVIPQFESLYQSLNSPLPPATAKLLAISTLLRSWYGLGLLIGFALLVLGCLYARRQRAIRLWGEQILIKTPVIAPIIIMRQHIIFMQTLALFTSSGIPLTLALENICTLTDNQLFAHDVQTLINAIVEGKSLSVAIKDASSRFFNQELATLVSVGEKMGSLHTVLDKAGQAYQQLLTRKLQKLSTLFAPILMLIVGLLITGLMVIMYLPIVNLGNLFHF